jgi:hypothetical protein
MKNNNVIKKLKLLDSDFSSETCFKIADLLLINKSITKFVLA